MADFIFRANIAHYKELLESETDAMKLAVLRRLLAEENAKFAAFLRKPPNSNAAE
jgi:hypothetical protein